MTGSGPDRARRIRVVHLVNNLNFGGMERIIAEMVRRTDPTRFELHVLAFEYLGHFSEGLDAHASLHTVGPMSRLSLAWPAALARKLRAIGPDVAHVHSGVWLKSVRAAAVARVARVVYTDHGRQHPDPWLNRWIDRQASRGTDVVVAVSEALRTYLQSFVADPDRVVLVRNGVDTDQYAPRSDDGSVRRELGLDAGDPLIGSVGRLERVKGYEIMVAAFAQLMREWDGPGRPALVVVGDGSERDALERDARLAGIADRIAFRGWRSDIERHLAEFDLFTMSSHSEGTSVSLLEAMSSGLCPVVTRVGGNSAVLGAALAHRLVPPADPAALAGAWRDAYAHPDRRLDDAVRARQRVLDEYSLGAMVSRYEALYAPSA